MKAFLKTVELMTVCLLVVACSRAPEDSGSSTSAATTTATTEGSGPNSESATIATDGGSSSDSRATDSTTPTTTGTSTDTGEIPGATNAASATTANTDTGSTDACMTCADTTGDGTTGADTTGADTTGADTTGADTTGADTTGAGTTGEPPPELGPFDVEAISTGQGVACAVLHGGKVKCWGGYNYSGELGLGNTDPYGTMPGTMGNNLPHVDLGADLAASAIANYYQGCVVVTGDKLKCWGQGTYGALGHGGGAHIGDEPGEMGDALPFVDLGAGRTVKHVAAGVWTTCAILDNDTLKCWGFNDYGWLGQGDTQPRGYVPEEMGDGLLPVDLGLGRTVKSIALDNSHACAVLDDGTVKCWGQQYDGNLGNGKPGVGSGPGDSPGEMGDNLPTIALGVGRTAKRVAVGNRHTCVILDNDRVKCWGSNTHGQLGLGDKNSRGNEPGEMGDALPYVDLGMDRTAVQIAAHDYHSCAILDDKTLKCWGDGTSGVLGQGDTQPRGDAPGEMGDALPPIDLGIGRHAISVSVGATRVCALLDNHRVKCWGRAGIQGALGYEDMQDRGDQPGEMGDNLPFVDLGS